MVPDSFDKNHIKEMMNILLCKLGFSSAIIHQVRKVNYIATALLQYMYEVANCKLNLGLSLVAGNCLLSGS